MEYRRSFDPWGHPLDPFREHICYIPSGFDGKPCESKKDCGKAYCVLIRCEFEVCSNEGFYPSGCSCGEIEGICKDWTGYDDYTINEEGIVNYKINI
jgi:hypothetical protein